MNRILTIFILLFVSTYSFGQGSGKALVFDGANNNIQLNNTFKNQNGTSSFTVCAWVLSTNVAKAGQRILCDDENNTQGYAISLGDPGSGRIRFYVRGLATVSLDVPAGVYQLTNNNWYHVSATYNNTLRTRNIYVNGELAATHTHGVGEWASTEVDNGPVTIGGESNASSESANRFQGKIDEVSYWEKELSQTEIRNLMCKSLSGSETNLYGYWNFDGAALGVNNLPDLTGNGYTGTLQNMMASEIVNSEAPIGTSSDFYYTSTWAGVTLNQTSATKGNFEINTISGSPRSVHVYRVDAVPNSTTGLSGLGSNNTYFGVFLVGGTSPSYNVSFDYSNYPEAITNESSLILSSRLNNSITSWTDISATINISTNTLSKNSISNNSSEFILSNPSTPLPVKLLSFEANFNNDKVDLKWITTNEINNDFFTIERSSDAKNWEEIIITKGSGNSNSTIEYFETDFSPLEGVSYYRLKQTDFDGNFEFFNIIPVKSKKKDLVTNIFPNPIVRGEELKILAENYNNNILIVIRDIKGQEYYSKANIVMEGNDFIAIPIANDIPAGIYLVTATSENQIYNQKLIIK